jgi:hypothetical protein
MRNIEVISELVEKEIIANYFYGMFGCDLFLDMYVRAEYRTVLPHCIMGGMMRNVSRKRIAS